MTIDRSLEGLRALVVEDEYFLAEDLKRVLKREGAVVVKLASNIEDAVRQATLNNFDFGLFDINIHGQMMFLAADEFTCRRIPFAFISGYGREAIPPRYATIPAWGKPYDERAIIYGIQALWRRPMTA